MSVSAQPGLAFTARRLGGIVRPEALYRVYFAPGGLFFIRVAGERATSAYMRMGLAGVFLHWLQNRGAAVEEKVSDLNQRSLKDRLEDHPANFRVPFSEIQQATLGPPAVFTTTGANCGRLILKLAKGGKRVFEFEDIESMRTAVIELPRVLADRITVDVEWHDRKNRYIKRRKP